MAAQNDLQELLRIFTSRKVSMMGAMGHLKALQAKNLKSIEQIANAPLADVEAAITDAKLAKSVHTACKSHGKKGVKRAADEPTSPTAKKPKLEIHRHDLDYSAMTPDELEGALSLPLVEDEETIRNTTLFTNRAPLVLAFAVELLRFTMPEQPPSSRLSLAQAVVSANSRSKAISLGIEKPGGEMQISEGQPKVRVMGREIPVLKRGDYKWKEPESVHPASSDGTSHTKSGESAAKTTWTASSKLTSRASTFIAHATPVSSPSRRLELLTALMSQKPELETASHNAWGIRTSYGNSPLKQEASFDDGESGCGKFILEILREAELTNTFVVLTRWYGGIMLGPDRWRLMRECINEALASQRRTSSLSGEALWGLDPQDTKPVTSTVGMAIHRPEVARNYLLRTFVTAPQTASTSSSSSSTSPQGKKTTTMGALNEEKQNNLGKLLGALRMLFASWAGAVSRAELDRKAWSWYVLVRPDVEAGPSGWGAKGNLSLGKILDLRRRPANDAQK